MNEPERREFVVTCGGPQKNRGVSRAQALEIRVEGGKERFKKAESPSDGALSGRLLLAPLTVDAEWSEGDRAAPLQQPLEGTELVPGKALGRAARRLGGRKRLRAEFHGGGVLQEDSIIPGSSRDGGRGSNHFLTGSSNPVTDPSREWKLRLS